MTQVTEVIRGWLGWCPNVQGLRGAPTVIPAHPVQQSSIQPGGGARGAGRLDRGFGFATGSIKVLIKNLRLLWFALITGLVMIANLAVTLYIQISSGDNPLFATALGLAAPASIIAKGSAEWIVLTFGAGLIFTFLSYLLLGALMVCTASIISGTNIPVVTGLSRAVSHARPLLYWAAIGAAVGTVLSYEINFYAGSLPFLLLLTTASVAFFVLTMFVVPAIVIQNNALISAIRGSVSLFRQMWGEIVSCYVVFLVIAFIIMLISVIPLTIIGFSTGNPFAANTAIIVYMLIMVGIVFLGSTIIGIATLGMYIYGKTGTITPYFGSRTEEMELS
jgi:hypothetical protein